MRGPDLSIIIPVLDEAQTLPRLFAALAQAQSISLETIVVDGGSRDRSKLIAAAHDARVLDSAPGRGRQMNAGAQQATAPFLLFLHADTRPQSATQLAQALAQILAAIKAAPQPRVAGHFALEFERDEDRNKLLYRYMQEKTASGRRYTINGDQGLLIARDWFFELGGFDTRMPFLEDQRMAATIHDRGQWLLLPGRLITSARRFETEGAKTRYILMAIIMAMYAVRLDTFFERAPRVYAAQGATGRLLLTPYFRCLRSIMRDFGWRKSLHYWLQVGHFVVGQSWQLLFVLDVAARPLLGAGRYPATAFHDRVFAPLTHHRVGAWVTALLVFIYTMGVLAPWYRWRERRQPEA